MTKEQAIALASARMRLQAQSTPKAAPDPFGASTAMGIDFDKPDNAAYPIGQTLMDVPGRAAAGVAGTAKGVVDLPLGGAQLLSKLLPKGAQTFVDDYMRQRDKSYREVFGDKADSVEIGRTGGNIVAALPIGGKMPAPSLAGRMWQGFKTGGTLGLTMPVSPDAPDYWKTKGIQTGFGAVGGALAAPVLEGVTRAASTVINKLSGKASGTLSWATGKTTEESVESTLRVELQRQGVDWKTLGQEARKALVAETKKALEAGGKLDTQALARVADFKRIGIEPTAGQVTRNPSQYRFEQNIARTEVGEPLSQRLVEQNKGLLSAVDDVRANTGGAGTDPYAAGQTAIKALRGVDAPRKAAVTAAYQKARDMAGEGANVPMQPIAQRLGTVIEEFGGNKIPADVMSRAKEFGLLGGKQTRIFTVAEAERFRKLIGNNVNPADASQARALGLLKDSVDDAVGLLASRGDEIGSAAAAQFGSARQLASNRFSTIKETPALAASLDKTKTLAPEKFVDEFVLRGSIDDVANLTKQLRQSPEAFNEARASVVEWLKRKAIGSGSEEMAQFSQAGYNRAIQSLGDRKLGLLFSAEEQQALRTVGRVAEAIQKPPTAAGVNYSGSATTLIDMLDRIGRFPVIGPLLGKPGDIARASLVSKSLNPSPVRPVQLINPASVERAAPFVGLLGAPAVGASTGLLGR